MGKTASTKSPEAKEYPVQKNFLDSLPIMSIPTKTTGRGSDPIAFGRATLINGINDQKQLVNDDIAGKPIATTTFKVNGKERTREAARWYAKLDDGFACTLRYGQVPVIKTKTDGKDVAAYWPAGKTLKDVLTFFDKLIAAIERGELDERIAEIQKPRARTRSNTEQQVA